MKLVYGPIVAFRSLRRWLRTPLLALAIIVVLIDDLFRAFVVPAVRALARLALIRRLEQRIARMPPTGILMLFIIPLAIIEPFKIYGLYLFGEGRFLAGIMVFALAKVVGLGLAERLFAIGRDKLLSIRWFAWCHAMLLVIRNQVHVWLVRTRIWPQAMRVVRLVREALATVRGKLARVLDGRRGGRIAAARRLTRRGRVI